MTRSLLQPEVMERHRRITVCADIMHVNGIPFLITLSRNVRFGTVEELKGKHQPVVMKAFDNVIGAYKAGGFKVEYALIDGKFECYRADLGLREVTLNTTARDSHVGDIERYIRTIKERTRASYNSVPFKRIPALMVIEMVKHSVFWRNAFPAENGISDELSPRAIVTGSAIDYNRHCKYELGEYVQTHEEHDNSMGARTVGAIALRPTGNAQGSHYFMSLATGRRINRQNATKLPMPAEVIDRVHALARRQNANRGLIFADRNGNAFINDEADHAYDDDDDSTYAPSDSEDDNNLSDEEDPADEDSDEGSDYNPDSDEDSIDEESIGDRTSSSSSIGSEQDSLEESTGVHEHVESAGVPTADDDAGNTGVSNLAIDPEESTGVDEDSAEPATLETIMDERYGPRSQEHNLRPRRQPKYSLVTVIPGPAPVPSDEVLATPQMSMKQGLKVFGEDGVQAVKAEMQQLHDRKVMEPRQRKDLTPEQRRQALAYLMFLKRKRCGKIKGRGCADGRKQRDYISPEDAASPTVATEAVFLTALIDAIEGREVAVIDIPGAFMQADMDEEVHVRFAGKMAELLLEIDPDLYGPYVVMERGETVLYVELLKALYGTMRAARLFWERLSATLTEWGFKPNPHDPCVMNKMIDGKQLTVAWHVDDLKVSHVLKKVVDEFIVKMQEVFGKESPLSESRGKVHDYLGMTLDFSKPGELSVTMIDYIKMVLAGVPNEMRGTANTPAAAHLFSVNDTNPIPLDDERAKIFYRVVMQLQYLSQRARPDLRTAISFLCKRVTKSDEDDYKKLIRTVQYLDATVDLPLVLSVDGSGDLYWYVDASFGVHNDMKSHTGGTFTMGKGSVYSTSSTQKLVARSSTEAELIGVHDVLPQMLWTLRFLQGQGFKVNGTILYQDNKSAILLEKNGQASSSRRTRHIKLRYYFVKEHVDDGTIRIEYCPTKEMSADYFTKPLQGSLFYTQRDEVMNIDPSSPYHSSHRSVLRGENCEPVSSGNLTGYPSTSG